MLASHATPHLIATCIRLTLHDTLSRAHQRSYSRADFRTHLHGGGMQDTDCINACRQLHLWGNDNLVDLAMPASMQAANPTSLEFLAR